jgi:transposase
MMAQNDLVVVGIDVAKDKVNACIRRLSLRQTFPNTAQVIASWLPGFANTTRARR